MRNLLPLAAAVLALGATQALAFGTDPTPQLVPDHVRMARYNDSASQPYAMNYSDEAAQTLGMKDGRWEAFKSDTPGTPSFNAGVDGGRPMLRLQWR